MTGDARLFNRAVLVALKNDDAPDCIVECARLLHEREAAVPAPDVTEAPHA